MIMKLSRWVVLGMPVLGLIAVGFWMGLRGGTGHSTALSQANTTFPEPTVDSISTSQPPVIVLAGGCFWGMEGLFEHTKGVLDVVAGYAGGSVQDANYERVGTGQTSHAEAVQITYNPAQISYGQLLKIYFSVAHDPTQVNQQGPDRGPQYRSAIFFTTSSQRQTAETYIQQLNAAQIFKQPIATTLEPLVQFYAAEGYHQNFMARNPNDPYVVRHDLPKLKALQNQWPQFYVSKKAGIP